MVDLCSKCRQMEGVKPSRLLSFARVAPASLVISAWQISEMCTITAVHCWAGAPPDREAVELRAVSVCLVGKNRERTHKVNHSTRARTAWKIPLGWR